MSRELECFKRIKNLLVCTDYEKDTVKSVNEIVPRSCYKIEQALQRLDSIDNATPNEALIDLEKIKIGFGCDMAYYNLNLEYETVKQTLLKARDLEKEIDKLKGQMKYLTEVITDFQKILSIVKKKDVDIYILQSCETVDEYNSKIVHIVGETRELTKEEFELLKRYLNNK